MKKLFFSILFLLIVTAIQAQADKTEILQNMEKNQSADQNVTKTATLKSSSRLFGEKDDLTSVILIIPADSSVTVLGSDSTYLHVAYNENEGYIYSRDAVITEKPVTTPVTIHPQQPVAEAQPAQQQQDSRFSYLRSKYGPTIASRLNAGKIWKGMNTEMVKDSWGPADKINRIVSGNLIKEEWIFKNTWLYFENNTLIEWGPTRR